ncbi:MAG: hypothetical protein NXI10_03880 [bacterium]|nr:hypothetical protein [bacterium]
MNLKASAELSTCIKIVCDITNQGLLVIEDQCTSINSFMKARTKYFRSEEISWGFKITKTAKALVVWMFNPLLRLFLFLKA